MKVAKIIVCGGRDYADREFLFDVLDTIGKDLREVITGGAPGADTLAIEWAQLRGVELTVVKAEWDKHGRKAGPMRNGAMLKLEPDAVFAFPGGRGTADMVRQAHEAEVSTFQMGRGQAMKARVFV